MGMTTLGKIPCTEEQFKKINELAKKAGKTFIKYVLDKCLEEDIKENKLIEKNFKKAIKEIQKEKDRDYIVEDGKGIIGI